MDPRRYQLLYLYLLLQTRYDRPFQRDKCPFSE